MFASLTSKENWQRYLKSLKYSLYVITHPIDGFWDLTHERRGSYAAANTILFLTILARILSLRYTSFIFIQVYWEELNILTYILSILFPLALFVIGNWALTTLFDGKGRLGQVYMATCYALTPYPLIHFPLMIFSNFITVDEAEFYSTMAMIALIWIAFIGIFGMSQVHEYSFGKNILFLVATVFAMLVMIFILMLFFSMVSQGVAYFISLGKEMLYRM
ncbi:MAG: YIP1 family protein [Lachnospiraceae bacterium]|nr:YIP1 family protein [Lachnospiraceae bacterium]MBO7600538.1 YIP1 family protein [Lachnospiraceae bacterium]